MGKPKDKPFSLQDVKNEVKNKIKRNEKENINMNKWKTPITVAITIAAIAALGYAFYLGMNFGISQERSINQRAMSEAKSLVTITEPKK